MRRLCAILSSLAGGLCVVNAATTINATNSFSYGANFGWMNWRGNTNAGAVIGDFVCSGYIYAANLGWVSLGGGSPTNGIQYQNLAAGDYGVNHDGVGNLRGYAYGANFGWINFENIGAPKVDLKTGRFSGSIYSANCGWISLSNAFAQVQTDSFASGVDTDGDGIADAFELTWFGNLSTANAVTDFDGDGMSDLAESLAGTNPTDPNSLLAITSFTTAPGGVMATLVWKSVLSRCYRIEKTLDLVPAAWVDSGLGLLPPGGVTTSATFADTNAPTRFYRVRAVKPLLP